MWISYEQFKHLLKQEAFEKVGPIRHCEPPLTLPFTRCRYCRTPPAHRCPQQHRQQRQRVTEGTAMAPRNGPNKAIIDSRLRPRCATYNDYCWSFLLSKTRLESRMLCLSCSIAGQSTGPVPREDMVPWNISLWNSYDAPY